MLLVASPLLLLTFFLLSLCQFDQYVSWRVSPWVYPVWDSLCLLDLIDYSLFHVGGIFKYNLFKSFLIPFLFLFFFWDPYNSNVGGFDIISEVSESILSSFHAFYFILLFRSYFHHFIFQLTASIFCLIYSAINSFQSIFNFINCVFFVSVCFFFNSSRSLLIDYCIFSILFSKDHLYYHFSEFLFRQFAYSLFIYLDFCVSSQFLYLCSISLPLHYFFI